ncbi:MAG: hypothetical protein AB7F43_00805 [Bacteriovoracia bacterium]
MQRVSVTSIFILLIALGSRVFAENSVNTVVRYGAGESQELSVQSAKFDEEKFRGMIAREIYEKSKRINELETELKTTVKVTTKHGVFYPIPYKSFQYLLPAILFSGYESVWGIYREMYKTDATFTKALQKNSTWVKFFGFSVLSAAFFYNIDSPQTTVFYLTEEQRGQIQVEIEKLKEQIELQKKIAGVDLTKEIEKIAQKERENQSEWEYVQEVKKDPDLLIQDTKKVSKGEALERIELAESLISEFRKEINESVRIVDKQGKGLYWIPRTVKWISFFMVWGPAIQISAQLFPHLFPQIDLPEAYKNYTTEKARWIRTAVPGAEKLAQRSVLMAFLEQTWTFLSGFYGGDKIKANLQAKELDLPLLGKNILKGTFWLSAFLTAKYFDDPSQDMIVLSEEEKIDLSKRLELMEKNLETLKTLYNKL